jgi:hypothetical protein
LDDIALEGFERQSSVTHSHDEGMVNKLLPDVADIRALEKPLDEVAAVHRVSTTKDEGRFMNVRSKWERIGRVEVV